MQTSNLRKLRIFDTTLRDGDQTAGFAFSSIEEKIQIAKVLDNYGVDCIEAGFPCSSQMEFDSCVQIANLKLNADIAVMTRCLSKDIKRSSEVFQHIPKSKRVLHISLPISAVQAKLKLRITQKEVLDRIADSIQFALQFADTIEMGFEDATRALPEFLVQCCKVAVKNRVKIINIADTTGFLTPFQTKDLVCFLKEMVPAFASGDVLLSMHCHNDSGTALSSALAAVENGAGQIETTIGGIGERCGNVPLEQLIYILSEQKDLYRVSTKIKKEKTAEVCRTLFSFIGTDLSPLKPVSGWNTSSHASGIHQQGLCIDPKTYLVYPVEEYGMVKRRFILSRHSGTAGLKSVIMKIFKNIPDIEHLLTSEKINTILFDIKSSGTSESAVSLTELCRLLYKYDIVTVQPYECTSFSVQQSVSEDNNEVSVQAQIERPDHKNDSFSLNGKGNTIEEACIKALYGIGKKNLEIVTLSLTGYMASEVCKIENMKLYMEIKTKNKLYAVSRSGISKNLLCFKCLLDVVNLEQLTVAQLYSEDCSA